VPRLDLGADPLPRPIPVVLSHPRAPRRRTFDGSIPPFDDWTDLFQGVRVICLPQSVGQSFAQRVQARNLLFWLSPIMTLGTKMWTSVATIWRSPPRKPFHSAKLLSLVLSGGLMTYLAPFHLGSLYRDSDDKNLLSDGLNIYNKRYCMSRRKNSQDMKCFLKPSWGDLDKEISEWDEGDQRGRTSILTSRQKGVFYPLLRANQLLAPSIRTRSTVHSAQIGIQRVIRVHVEGIRGQNRTCRASSCWLDSW